MPSVSSLRAPVFSTLFAAATSGASSSSTVQSPDSEPTSLVRYGQVIVASAFGSLWASLRVKYQRAIGGQWNLSDMVQLLALCGVIQSVRVWRDRREESSDAGPEQERKARGDRRKASWIFSKGAVSDTESTDPGLLKKYSRFKSFTTSIATYPSIRVFYRPHPQADKLPSVPTPLPLLVFIHGLGGSLAQFNPLLTSLVNVAPTIGIDLPGCGRSSFAPTSWNAYTIKALAELLIVMIRQHCAQNLNQEVILIGHSMGCSLSVMVASSIQSVKVLGLVAICPQASPPSPDQVAMFERLLSIPTPIFDIWRTWDRRGGPESAGVTRFVGQGADIELKKLQERFNRQSRTAVWRRMAWGALPARGGSSLARGLPGPDIWGSLKIPLFLVGGEGDNVTKIDQIVEIGKALGKIDKSEAGESEKIDVLSPEVTPEMDRNAEHCVQDDKRHSAASKTELTVISETLPSQTNVPSYSRTRRVLKTSILPVPASHALLYDPATYRTVAGLIHTFLSSHVDTRLSLGWQLQHLSTEGKWDVKNLVKWQAVRPVSEPIAGIFRAMKTLREIDEVHSPDIFVRNWKGRIRAVVDISHESPVYDPKGLDEGGIEYHKLPTVSKIPPTPEEVRDFIKLVDRLRTSPSTDQSAEALIGVHCHYGFNRTGFFICCYLIEKEGMGVQQAVDEFAKRRLPGIRHEHFLDQLFVRYCIGLKRAPTL